MALNIKIIGRRVKESRIQKHMSQADLAEQIDMSVTYISLIETAKRQASPASLVRISNVLGITVDNLLNGNQVNDLSEYHTEWVKIFEGCTSCEKRIIYEIALAVKCSLIENRRQ